MALFESKRLCMRCFTLADAAAAHSFHGDPRVMGTVGDGRLWSRGPEDITALKKIVARYESGPLGFWAVEEKQTGRLIGHCLLLPMPELESVEVGWLLAHHMWGQGYGFEMARATVDYGFEVLGLPELVAVAEAGNAASIAIMGKLGMTQQRGVTHCGIAMLCYQLSNPADLSDLDGPQTRLPVL